MEKNFDPDAIPPEGDITGAKLPSYMRKAPWYFNTGKDNLDHLRMTPWAQPKESNLSQFVKHGRLRNKEIVKWKPGCCKNCGASTHTEFDCPERPRKRTARITGESIIEKEVIEEEDLSYDAKHDCYANYDKTRWWHEVRGHYRHADKVRLKNNQTNTEKIVIQEEYGHAGFRNRLDTADYIDSIGKVKHAVEEPDDLFVKPISKEKDSKEVFLMAWEGDENMRRKNRGLDPKKTKEDEFSVNKPKLINANAVDEE